MGDDNLDDEKDGESEGGKQDASAAAAGLSKIIKILVYVVGGVLALFLITGISYLVSKYVQEKSYQREQDIVVAPPPPPLARFDLNEFSATTKDAEPHFIKISLVLGYDEGSIELNNELIKRQDQMKHIINMILRGKAFSDLDSIEDSIGLAEEIKAHINVILISGKIKEVYFKEFIVN